MAVHGSPGSRADSVVLLSPQQFHACVQEALQAAVAARDDAGREEALRRLFGVLREVPSLGPGGSQPADLPPILVDGVRSSIKHRETRVPADPERMLADLMELVLAFYPEAAPPC